MLLLDEPILLCERLAKLQCPYWQGNQETSNKNSIVLKGPSSRDVDKFRSAKFVEMGLWVQTKHAR